MLDAIREFFDAKLGGADLHKEERSDEDIQLATAALLIELGRCDEELDERESQVILDKLRRAFGLSDETLTRLMQLADEELKQATDLYQFTALINEHYNYDEKLKLLLAMWRVAYADDHIDKYEEHMIRKVAGLIHVPHSDFIRTKHQAR